MVFLIIAFYAEQDGKLRVFKWPSMEIIIDEANAHSCVKDLDFRFIVVTFSYFHTRLLSISLRGL